CPKAPYGKSGVQNLTQRRRGTIDFQLISIGEPLMTENSVQRRTRVTESSHVRTRQRAAIRKGAYAPKQRLIEADLADEYSTSRFNVRNALITLAAEGLIELQPNRGARIREVTIAEAIEISEIRQAIEALVAARAAERIDSRQIASLRRLGEKMETAVAEGE